MTASRLGLHRYMWGMLALIAAGPAFGDTTRPAEETIGSWVLACPPITPEAKPEPCILRDRDWVLKPNGDSPSAALEVQMRGDALVPVVTLRGLPSQTTLGGSFVVKPSVGITFDGGARSDMSCGSSATFYACAPVPAAVPVTAALLPTAHTATVAITLSIPGFMTLPTQEKVMTLSGTPAALARLREVGAIGEALPELDGLDMQTFLDRVFHDLGFQNGTADVIPMVMPLMGWLKG